MFPSTSETAALRAQVRLVARAYMEQARVLSYDDVRERQGPPWGGIALGAGGIVSALARTPARKSRDSAADLDRADALLAAIRGGETERDALWGPGFTVRDLTCSLSYGVGGFELLELRLAARRADTPATEPLLEAFLHRCRSIRGGPHEAFFGVSGYLAGLVTLHRTFPDPRLLDAADLLADGLLERARVSSSWTRDEKLGFAHGRAGVFHALLGWSLARGSALPPRLFDDLARLASDAEENRATPTPRSPLLERSWCTGAAGFALLWARAYEATGERAHLRRAQRAGRKLLAYTSGAMGDLCCGLGGRAYALLAIDRVQPDAGWSEHALRVAASAMAQMVEQGGGDWPNGLYKGFPGLVCLAEDVLGPRSRRVGLPLVEG